MRAVNAYDKYYISFPDNGISGGGRQFLISSSKEAIVSLVHTINFIDNCIQCSEGNYYDIIELNKQNMNELFTTIPISLPTKILVII